jgi:hypothetical protein
LSTLRLTIAGIGRVKERLLLNPLVLGTTIEWNPLWVCSTMDQWGIGGVAPDGYCTKHDMILKDHREGVISLKECKKREEELTKEVAYVFGQPQRSRPYCESVLSEFERDAKKRNPALFIEEWEKLWREWEERETKDTQWFWDRWGGKVMLVNLSVEPTSDDPHKLVNGNTSDFESRLKTMQSTLEASQAYAPDQIAQVAPVEPTSDDPHKLVNGNTSDFESRLKTMQSTLEASQAYAPDQIAQVAPVEPTSDDPHKLVNGNTSDFESRLKTMQSTLEASQAYAPDQIAQVAAVVKSRCRLPQGKRNRMAETLKRVQYALGRGFEKIGEGIATLLKAVQNGLAPDTKGYKALQENFDEFVQAISQLSILHELTLKAHSKGLISRNGKEEIFAPGGSGLEKANKFLELIRARIKRDGKAYDTFVSILRSEPAYHHLVTLAGGI